MPDIQFDTYYRYDAITSFLQDWAARYPNLCRLESLGQSFEGRDIWLVTLTNAASGPDNEKPAYWVDANIHATEVAPSSAALYLIHKLLTQYGQDDKITYALDSRVFYVVPRLNPDGAEWALADRPKFVRSSTRPYPRTEELDGFFQEDVDGDGRILSMRLKDPNGAWKVHPQEPRLLIPRAADDLPGGDYYRLLPEGQIRNYDGVTIDFAPPVQGLDLNRNFPVHWSPDQQGAGPYPTSEPEIRPVVQFITDHPNITGALTFHTFSGVHLRPPTAEPEDKMPTQDLYTYKAMGKKGTELTGYPAVSVFHDFKYDPKEYIKGTFDDWMYEHLGVYAWTTEIWSVQQQAGIKDYKFMDWFREHPVEDDVKIMNWLDETLDGEGYVDWYPFEHPQLGQVELGGWHTFLTWRNPPYKLLEKEIAPLADFVIYNCLVSPRLELHSVETESHGDLHKVRLVVHNTGWLPTNITEQAMKMKVVRPLEVDLALPAGATLITGQAKTQLGQLKGRDHKGVTTIWGGDPTSERAKVEWVIRAPAGSEITITASHQRAGTLRTTVTLG
ncbi:MAG: carboxypeptidase [Ardenticatenaceae bacterium]|nr:carboxypeptidase [Ardenticatenaceae bacterium]